MVRAERIILKLFISTILVCMFFAPPLWAQEIIDSNKLVQDTVVQKEEAAEKHFQYFRVGVDVSKIIRSSLTSRYSTTEFLLETVWKKNMHYVLETGAATSQNRDSNASFDASSYFMRIGFDKYFFGSAYEGDMDNASAGLRLGGAYNRRQAAEVMLWDPYYGNTMLTKPAQNNLVYWLELTIGFRMEMTKNIFVGWNIRGKTFLNPKKIEELTPNFIAGYGAAKKQPSFDYNLYLLYGFGKR